MATIVYKYTLKAPIDNEELLRSEMETARRYRNLLVEVCRGARDALRGVLLGVQDVASAYAAAVTARDLVLAAHEAVKLAHAETRSREHSDLAEAELRAARTAYIGTLRAFETSQRAARRLPEVRAELDRIDALANEFRKNVREHYGPWWGTYWLVDADMERSLRRVIAPGKSIARPLWDGVDPNDPHFVRRGEYTDFVSCYVNDSMRPRTHDFVRIEAPVLRENARPGEKPKARFALRIGTDAKRQAIFARWPMHKDRPIPADAEITGVKVTCTKEGRAERWHAHVTLRTNTRPRGEPIGSGAVGVDIGWRRIGDELRVACWRGEDGSAGEIRLNAQMIGSLTKAESLRSIRDRWFNEARKEFRNWLDSREIPDWLRTATENLDDWRSPARLAGLANCWRRDEALHFEGAWDAILALEIWRRQDAHLWHWESAQRNHGLARRKEFYRAEAAKLARRFGNLVMEQFDLRTFARLPDVLDEGEQSTRYAARLAACGEFRSVLEQAFLRRGGTIERVDPLHTTHLCPKCGAHTEFDAARAIDWVCGGVDDSGCGARWDQDDSAAAILLARKGGSTTSETAEALDLGKPPSRKSKWQRVKIKKQERLTKETDA